MIATYQRSDLVEEAVTSAAQRNEIDRDNTQAELEAITAELASVDAKIDRYLTAFENGNRSIVKSCG